MTEQAIKEGDVVQLKSGSPAMTVTMIDGNTAHVRWFDGAKSEHSKMPLIALKHYEDPTPHYGAVDKR